jgi:predicted metalloprotease with PDZ domain
MLTILIIPLLLSSCSEQKKYTYKFLSDQPWLGVRVKELSERRLKNLKLDHGLEVTNVYRDSPADSAGLQVEDIIVAINNEEVRSTHDLMDLVHGLEINDKMDITYLRGGDQIETTAILDERGTEFWPHTYARRVPHKEHASRLNRYNEDQAWLGIKTVNLTDQLRQYFSVPDELGVLINEIEEDSPAQEFGLQAGDIIIGIENRKIRNRKDLLREIDRYNPQQEIELTLIRKAKEEKLNIKLGRQKRQHIFPYSFNPEEFEFIVPEVDIDISEIEIPDIPLEEMERLNEKVLEEIEINAQDLEEKMEELNDKLKDMEIKLHQKNNAII